MGVALAGNRSKAATVKEFVKDLEASAAILRSTRPTAVNLFWALDRVLKAVADSKTVSEARTSIISEVKRMEDEDVEVNRRLGRIGAELLDDGDTVLTQCNAGSLATVGYGTALGVVRAAVEQGKSIRVLVPETRPALQGSRLTAFELARDGIPCTIIPDTAVGFMLAEGRADKVVVGADRITRDGYVFNKIGTYQEAVLARRHGVPFYAVAPFSTFDLKHTHGQVVIEQRGFDEVIRIRGRRIAPKGVPVANPAFDMTPPGLLTKIVSDRGLIGKPFAATIPKVIS